MLDAITTATLKKTQKNYSEEVEEVIITRREKILNCYVNYKLIGSKK